MVNKRDKNEGAKKTATTTAPKLRAIKPKATAKPAGKKTAKPLEIRQEDIAFRAYLISERRQQLGLPGDSLSDWVEAERQLLGAPGTNGAN